MMARRSERTRTIGCGAGFAGDRIDPAVALAASGRADAIVLECLAERTLVPGLRSRAVDPTAGADPRLRRRLKPLLPDSLLASVESLMKSNEAKKA